MCVCVCVCVCVSSFVRLPKSCVISQELCEAAHVAAVSNKIILQCPTAESGNRGKIPRTQIGSPLLQDDALIRGFLTAAASAASCFSVHIACSDGSYDGSPPAATVACNNIGSCT